MSAPAYNGQGSEGEHLLANHEVPLKLTTFSYFRDQFLNKNSYIWRIYTTWWACEHVCATI